MRAHEWAWLLMSSHEYTLAWCHEHSWALMSTLVITGKCWFSKWLPFSILAISQSRFHKIITKTGLLKNVQDRILRLLGSRENRKTKVETILVDPWILEGYETSEQLTKYFLLYKLLPYAVVFNQMLWVLYLKNCVIGRYIFRPFQ